MLTPGDQRGLYTVYKPQDEYGNLPCQDNDRELDLLEPDLPAVILETLPELLAVLVDRPVELGAHLFVYDRLRLVRRPGWVLSKAYRVPSYLATENRE